MSLFCLLYIPLLYFLRRSSKEGESIWALPLGIVAVVVRYFFGPLVTPGGFGLSRWMSGFVDIVALPALIPLMVCGILVLLRLFSRDVNYLNFALLWLAPLAATLSTGNSSSGGFPHSPLSLIVIPLLLSAQAIGIPFFIGSMVKNPRWYIVFFATLAIAALPIAAVTSWWAFFSQQTLLGFALLIVSLVPAVISLCVDLIPRSVYGDRDNIQILNESTNYANDTNE